MYGGVIYFRNGLHEFYKIDLDCLPEILQPIPNFNDKYAGWTVVDECIYCIGGIKRTIEGNRRTVCINLNKYNTASSSSTWELISPTSNLRLFEPSVFAWGRNIYVVGGSPSPFKSDWDGSDKNADPAYWGEYYNLDSQTWSYLAKHTFFDLCGFRVAIDQNTIVFYSVLSDILLLYNVDKEEWTEQHHPDLMLQNMVVQGLEKCNCPYALFYVANTRPPVVCHSTLYWLNNDMCLYGYDYVLRRWFQSNRLPRIDWPLSVDHESICFAPLLFYLNNQTFVAICERAVGAKLEMGMVIFGVERHPDRIVVSLNLYRTFHVDSPMGKISVYNGMAIRKDQKSLLGKRKSASED